MKGRVIRSTGKWYKVRTVDKIIDCRLPGKFRLRDEQVTNPIAVGDFVEISVQEDGTGTIDAIEKRRNYIPRKATHGRQGDQILAANIDRAWAVVSVRKPKINPGFIDRFLATCEAYEIPGGVIVNKSDYSKPNDQPFLDELSALYRNLGYRFIRTSIYDQESLEQLSQEFKGRVSVLIGPSGVGKTSLLNAIDPGLELRTGEVSSYSSKGKHTTTAAQLVELNNGGKIVDTPGIRELGLVDVEPWELSLFFPEMRPHRDQCKYYNCTHSHEPGCGITEAFQNGEINPERYNSYLNILESLEE